MHKRDYFIAAMKAECYRYKQWVIEAFSIVPQFKTEGRSYDYGLIRPSSQSDELVFIDPNTGSAISIEGASKGKALFDFHEELVIGPGDIPNLKSNITTTYGNLFVNYLCLVYPFGDKIDYMEGRIAIGKIEKIIESRLVDDPAPGANLNDPTNITVSEYIRFNEAALSLAGFTQLCVPAGSPKALMTDPKVAVRRQELLEQYKGQLNDPAIQARISDELIAMDKAWIKGDVSEGFFLKDKSFDVVRKKMYLLLGAETGFGVHGDLITTSLDDGWDAKDLPAMNNSLREGSFNRGAQTALGGEATKFNYRIFQNTTVVSEDCGSTLGLPVKLTKDNIDGYISSSVITAKGPVEITKENQDSFIDKEIILRSPAYCLAEAPSFCAVCIGKRIASTPTAIGTYAADVGSKFMGLFMAATHGTALKTRKYLLEESIG